jgi:hypothetical protein
VTLIPDHWRWHEGAVEQGPAVVFDMDGVLSDASNRQHFLEYPQRDWDAFFAACGDDALIDGSPACSRCSTPTCRSCCSRPPLRVRPQTLAWPIAKLRWDLLIMRDIGDYSASLRSSARPCDLRDYGRPAARSRTTAATSTCSTAGRPRVYIHSGYYD